MSHLRSLAALSFVLLVAGCGDEFPIGTSFDQHNGIKRSSPLVDRTGNRDRRGEPRQQWDDERPQRDEPAVGRRAGWGRDREMPSDREEWGRARPRPSDDMPSDREDWGRGRKRPSEEMPSDREDWGRGRRMPSQRGSFRKPLPSEK